MSDVRDNGEFIERTGVAEQLNPLELLEQVKLQMHERSRTEGQLVDLGVLLTEENRHLWNSEGISVARRQEIGEVTQEELDAAPAALEESFVQTTAGAAKRCIDGSSGDGYDDGNPARFGAGLGPQIQGGTPGEAVARRMAAGIPEDQPNLTIVDDIALTAKERKSDYTEGAHDDNPARDSGHSAKTGCGQLDGQPRKQPRYADPEAAAQYRGTADAVLINFAGITPPEGGFEKIQQAAARLSERGNYFSAPNNVLAAVRRQNPSGVETVIRPHNEITLTINLVPGTTFHRDHYNARTNGKIQNFNLDAWAVVKEHDALTAYALVIDAVATFMDLTDGSVRVLVRVPRQETTPLPEAA